MSYVPIQDLLAKTNSIYKLVVLASKRAVELNAGAPRLVEADGEKISSIALEEIAQGKVKLETEKKKG
jgi:DNA-directed RNA polymerase subunit omega